MHIDIESLERATLDAVAPETVEYLTHWALPFDSTTIGRAISAVPLRHDGIAANDIDHIEALYAARSMRSQFRVADVPGLANLQDRLQSRGFVARQPTLTMVSDTREWPQQTSTWTVHLSDTPTPAWQSVYLAEDFDAADGANRLKALSRSKCLLYGWIQDSKGAVAAGTAALSQGWMSVHGLRSLLRVRGKGCAFALFLAFGQHARSQNLQKCFLQVEESNENAIGLYRRLGFQTAWRYHYWRK